MVRRFVPAPVRPSRLHWTAFAALMLASQAHAQSTPPSAEAEDAKKLERVEVTGSLIKRTDRETPSVVQSITREQIRTSGYANVEELLRANSAVDLGSIGDGAASGFVGGVSTISLRGFGSQGTLILINGRRTAPLAAVDVNFGRGTMINVNTIPKEAIERIDILKDGASALYGSDAMAGVINYVLRKDYQGVEGSASYTANDRGVGATRTGGLTFGFGNLDTQRFNVFGGIEVSKRDNVMASELKDRGNLALQNQYLTSNGSLARFTPDSSASFYGNYYRVPTSLSGSTVINGISTANSSLSGTNYLGTLSGCPADRTVGQGVPNRPAGFAATTASLPTGLCRFNLDNADEAIAAQDRQSGMVRGTYVINDSLTAYADLMLSRTKTNETRAPYAMTTSLVTSGNPVATTWPKLDGSFLRQNAIILPVGHPDNPTNGTANAQPVQLIYRFEDLPLADINILRATRFTGGVEGSAFGWDFDTAVLYSEQKNERYQEGRVRSSLLNAAIASGSYRFGGVNSKEAINSVSSTAYNEGKSTITSWDLRGSRELFSLPGGRAAIALGTEVRHEKLTATPDDIYQTGDYIGLVANGASGSRTSYAGFAELSLPVVKQLELQAATRYERYSDFGNSTTGKLGFKWSALPSIMAFRGTAATGFRAPAISQIGDSFALSFHSFQERRVYDPLRCDLSSGSPVSRAAVSNNRDCNVLGFTAVPSGTTSPGSIPTVISANSNLQPEKSRSFTLGFIMTPSQWADFAIDGWYFHRRNEIRSQRGVDIMDDYTADPASTGGQVVRDPNPETWLPGVANSGPIIMLIRQYGNNEWTKTSGLDYDLNLRLPPTAYGKFSMNVQGTYTARYDQLIVKGQAVQHQVGTTTSDITKTRASATFKWDTDAWRAWLRVNHADPLSTTTCASLTAAQRAFLSNLGRCRVGRERTIDFGLGYSGYKGLTLSASVMNLFNDYNRASGIPTVFSYYDSGTQGLLGRRFSLNANYVFK
ncbi:TonB-dependent receptor plug domain-containing protein [Roseateles amylovorans]|uniref:TonB-dependent receptor n=1 Tax=Roseateles amylovorans TaxID=2978473 RepID=A0ABY6B0S7_9BURK|nr:TonB-dependent receptor [Roseateles amylovorans]UXH78792.1 TonB-dependent receptor [Roseateles amylovorans]